MSGLSAATIIQLLGAPSEDRRPIVRELQKRATVRDLIAALQQASTPLSRQILCDILGRRHAASAVPALTGALNDPAGGVRSAAAEALARIGTVDSGAALLDTLRSEERDGTRQELAIALGAVGYRPAIPTLIDLLLAQTGMLRGCAA